MHAQAWPQWVRFAVVATGFATRCLPWLQHARNWCLSAKRGYADIFNLVWSFNSAEHLCRTTLEFTAKSFVPRRWLSSGKCLKPTRDVRGVTPATVLDWFAEFRKSGIADVLSREGVYELLQGVFPKSWRLNYSHFFRWLSLVGLAKEKCDYEAVTGAAVQMTSSTNGNLFLQLCRGLGNRHSYESLHTAFLKELAALKVDAAAKKKLALLCTKVALDDSPGNMCKAVCALETFLFGEASNATSYRLAVGPSPLQAAITRRYVFRNTE